MLGRIVISVLFLPQYFRGEMYTAYELMGRRFGPRIRKFTAAAFLILRSLAEGVRVFAVSIVISIVLGSNEILSIAAIVCLTLFYTFEGGMTAVIWTDVVQMFLYIGGALASFFLILQLIPGGWPHAAALGEAAHKFQLFDFHFALTAAFFQNKYSFWAGLAGRLFPDDRQPWHRATAGATAALGPNLRESRLALFSSWMVVFFQFGFFLFIGVLLFVYHHDSGQAAPENA